MRAILQQTPVCRLPAFLAIGISWALSAYSQQENVEPLPPSSGSPGPVTTRSGTVSSANATGTGKLTKQIRVNSDDPDIRLAFTTFADTVDRDLRHLIRDTENWVYPISITVKGTLSDVDPGKSTANRIDLLPNNQFSLQLGIRLSTGFQRDESSRELLRLLLFERMLRPFHSNPAEVAGKKIDAPPWLLYGVEELTLHHQKGRPSTFYAGIVQSRQVLSAREILQGDPSEMDSLSAAVYKASSAALIASLLDQPKGHQNFREFLGDLAGVDQDEIEQLIRQHFPGLRASAGAIEKWWSLQIAHMGQKQAFEFLTAAETGALLDQALVVRFGVEPQEDPKGLVGKLLPRVRPGQPLEGRIHDFEKFTGRRDARAVLGESQLKLRSLSLNSFPLYRNVISRYEAVVLLLMQERKRGIRAELEAIDLARAGLEETMSRVTDHMNYYEATQAEGISEAFENYRATKKRIEQRRRPNRNDRISKYLDALEAEFKEKDSG